MKNLNKDENDILQSFEQGALKSVITNKSQLDKFKKAATATLQKNKRINIRVSEKDLNDIKLKAVDEGLPYQTLISSVLHKFVTGRLKERTT
ncbi:MAG TPA: hypothetical protein DF296_05775 [Candidatus Margulisbacteria bacterium]|nr:hypothetical protein [Candidatus Margulisiibacteriota bacterium]